ncbi:phosphotransferase [Moellerella wisconsensis]|uniref:Thiamine kinase n=1 Tax=Moellerella wisconsensis ATCC 35017 TaxID=1354267 RepID=A0A0N0IA33_9GAMM|nr:phosphotransferase [Moellerella wisconsensis]KPD02580.1 thiamine/adenosylcobinamide kinase [Moellerella wisconsensis ATCC 35017]VFS48187.1 Thiamine kinase [Moellerella wisconsensis]
MIDSTSSDPAIISLLDLLSAHYPQVRQTPWSITPLAGLSGGTYLLANGIEKLIARSQNVTQTNLSVSRKKEHAILRQLNDFDAAPQAIAVNRQWLLVEWLPGISPETSTFYSADFQRQLAQLVVTLHQHHRFSYHLPLREEISHYARWIDPRRKTPAGLRLHRHFMRSPLPKTLKITPAHMDIHADNLLISPSGQLLLLDWEYAANTDIGLSLACYFSANNLSLEQRQIFLSHYCLDYHAYTDLSGLENQCQLWEPWVKYMMLMWYEVRWQQSKNDQFLQHGQPLRQYFGLS